MELAWAAKLHNPALSLLWALRCKSACFEVATRKMRNRKFKMGEICSEGKLFREASQDAIDPMLRRKPFVS